MKKSYQLVFFGSSDFSRFCLDELKARGILPDLIVTTPDLPAGRKLVLKETVVKKWAKENQINCLSPRKLDNDFIKELKNFQKETVFLVASYGKIIPKALIDLPEYKVLNIHPSLLPKYRGPTPLQSQILNNESHVGVTLMQIDELVDHGAIVATEEIVISDWPVSFSTLEKITGKVGAKLFAEALPHWINGKVTAVEQKHTEATFTKKIEKNDGEITLSPEKARENYLKFLAYNTWPGIYFLAEKGQLKIRTIITDAEYKNGIFIIKKVKPAGKKEMLFADFERGL